MNVVAWQGYVNSTKSGGSRLFLLKSARRVRVNASGTQCVHRRVVRSVSVDPCWVSPTARK